MTDFVVDLDELQATVGQLTGLEQTVQSQLDRLQQTMARLQQTWSGQAAAAQKTAHDEWTASAHEMHAALTRMREAAEHAHGCYTAAAHANAKMWAQTR
jgi:WXG100 family type VII secretion target